MVGIAGITVAHFWTALVLLGVGWNFAFIGATTMVTQCHRPEERNKVQAFNDFLIFGSMAVALVSLRPVLRRICGWAGDQRGDLPDHAVVAGALLAWAGCCGASASARIVERGGCSAVSAQRAAREHAMQVDDYRGS